MKYYIVLFLCFVFTLSIAQRPLMFKIFDPEESTDPFEHREGYTITTLKDFRGYVVGSTGNDNGNIMHVTKLDLHGNKIQNLRLDGGDVRDFAPRGWPLYDDQRHTISYGFRSVKYGSLNANGGLFRIDTALDIQMLTYFSDSIIPTFETRSIARTPDQGYIAHIPKLWHGGNDEIIKVDSNGDFMWHQFIPDTFPEYYKFGNMISTSDDNYILSGHYFDAEPQPPYGNYSTNLLTKFTPSGSILWQKKMRATFFRHIPIIAEKENGKLAYVAETDSVPNEPGDSFRLYGLDSLANDEWQIGWTYLPSLKQILTINTTKNGDIIGCGFVSGFGNEASATQGWLFRVSKDGQLLWNRFFKAHSDNVWDERCFIGRAEETEDGRIAAVGTVGIYNTHVVLLVVDENGCLDPNDCGNDVITVSNEKVVKASVQLTLFPNPTASRLTVTLSDGLAAQKNLEARIFTANGQFVFSKKLDGKTAELDVSMTSSGLHYLSLVRDGVVVGVESFVINN